MDFSNRDPAAWELPPDGAELALDFVSFKQAPSHYPQLQQQQPDKSPEASGPDSPLVVKRAPNLSRADSRRYSTVKASERRLPVIPVEEPKVSRKNVFGIAAACVDRSGGVAAIAAIDEMVLLSSSDDMVLFALCYYLPRKVEAGSRLVLSNAAAQVLAEELVKEKIRNTKVD